MNIGLSEIFPFVVFQMKAPSDENPEVPITFRKLLLTRCQHEFERDSNTEVDLEKMQREIEQAETVLINIPNIYALFSPSLIIIIDVLPSGRSLAPGYWPL